MELKAKGVVIQVEAAKQSNEWLLDSSLEIAKAAKARGLDLTAFCGAQVIEGADVEVIPPAPARSTKELLLDQMVTTVRGYKLVIESMNHGRSDRDGMTHAHREKLANEFEAWFSEDKQAYIEAAQQADPELYFTLVATPNILLDDIQLADTATAFGEEQPKPTTVFQPLYASYTREQLSGAKRNNEHVVNFSLIPSKNSAAIDGTVSEQLSKLVQLQSKHAFLKVPSPFEAIAYWHTLRAGGAGLAYDTAHELTYISRFDLPIHKVEGVPYVPQTFVGPDGGPVLSYSGVQYGNFARIAVG